MTPALRPDARAIQHLFAGVARRYDLLNHLLSGGVDWYWRAVLSRRVKSQDPVDVLDLATGSGDVGLSLQRNKAFQGKCVGADFCVPMLMEARRKSFSPLCAADGLALPFRDGSFDAITIAFGFRNLTDRLAGLREMGRTLRPGGHIYILEFSRPCFFCRSYFWYLQTALPAIAGFFGSDTSSYIYLGDSIRAFPPQQDLAEMIRQAGYSNVTWENLTFGIVALHIGVKPTT